MELLLRILSKLLIAFGVLCILAAALWVAMVYAGIHIGEAVKNPFPGGSTSYLVALIPGIGGIASFILSAVCDHFAEKR